MKTFVITISRHFPAKHRRKGEPTYFVEKLFPNKLILHSERKKLKPFDTYIYNTSQPKLHTIRANYKLWKKRIDQVVAGNAILSVRYWSGKPYNSKQITVCNLTKSDGVGIQMAELNKNLMSMNCIVINGIGMELEAVSGNDGLSLDDFKEWFKGFKELEPMALIHFTNFRY